MKEITDSERMDFLIKNSKVQGWQTIRNGERVTFKTLGFEIEECGEFDSNEPWPKLDREKIDKAILAEREK
ncbi:MAG: hypothetical protein V4629_03365 [Pseudomonadota bacterium]